MLSDFDFIIVGSGLAGLNAALLAAELGTVALVTKKKLTSSNTFYAQGGIAAVWSQEDNFQKHIEDTMKAGCYHNRRSTVEFIVKNGPSAIKRLLNLGVQFSQDKKKLALHREGGHGEKRIIHAGDHTGQTIELKLTGLVKKNPDITIFRNTFVQSLLVKSKTCYGVQIIKNKTCQNIFGRKIILATGGLGQLYAETTNPSVATGDGISLAFSTGAKIADLEFIQFHPTAFAEKKYPLFLLSEALRGEGAILLNSQNQRFMPAYHSDAELAPRDVVTRAIFQEQKSGPVTLYFGRKNLQKSFPQIYAYLKSKGFDLEKDKIPVTPAAHFSCGGIATNLHGQTSIKHLYAFGEVACTGLHGANRLASNSLLEAAVMSQTILSTPLPTIKKIPGFKPTTYHPPTKSEQKLNRQIRNQLRHLMWEKVGIIRTKKDLTAALRQIKALQKQIPLRLQHQETANMLKTAELITIAALKRQKSLGCHFIERA